MELVACEFLMHAVVVCEIQAGDIYMPKLFQLVPPTKFPWYFLVGNVVGLGLSMVSSMQNRRYVANQQKFHCP